MSHFALADSILCASLSTARRHGAELSKIVVAYRLSQSNADNHGQTKERAPYQPSRDHCARPPLLVGFGCCFAGFIGILEGRRDRLRRQSSRQLRRPRCRGDCSGKPLSEADHLGTIPNDPPASCLTSYRQPSKLKSVFREDLFCLCHHRFHSVPFRRVCRSWAALCVSRRSLR